MSSSAAARGIASSREKGSTMRAKGISYDTGFLRDGESSRPHFDSETVRAERLRRQGAEVVFVAVAAHHRSAKGAMG
ncbi:hypothetical protein ACWF82_05740 [Nocardia sp. NPDC055053]